MQERSLAILGMGFICAAGDHFDSMENALNALKAPYQKDELGSYFPVPSYLEDAVEKSALRVHGGQRIDRTVKLALHAAQQCIADFRGRKNGNTLVNIGSSRGATQTWEAEFNNYLKHGKASPKTSPYTTPGNISSNIASLLTQECFVVDHSVTCGSGLQAIANGAAWLQAGMIDTAIVGGTEAPLSPFTRAQMQALKITAHAELAFPAKPLSTENPKTGMVLGEGAALFALGRAKEHPTADFFIDGIGLSNEKGTSASGITGEGKALYGSMKAALHQAQISKPDLIITHAPGTEKGDSAELNAIRSLFGTNGPALYSNKHVLGHTLGASGTLSLVTACLILRNGLVPSLPYPHYGSEKNEKAAKTILVNATGFGGNAISLLVRKNEF